jgi:hypothetical protein
MDQVTPSFPLLRGRTGLSYLGRELCLDLVLPPKQGDRGGLFLIIQRMQVGLT